MSDTWTPGPWELESVRMDCAGIIRQWPCRQAWLAGMWVTGPDGDAPVICDIVTRDPDGATDEDIANGRLIAAAPDLLEALVMVRDADEDCLKDGLPRWCTPAARARIDRAIAKARGKRP